MCTNVSSSEWLVYYVSKQRVWWEAIVSNHLLHFKWKQLIFWNCINITGSRASNSSHGIINRSDADLSECVAFWREWTHNFSSTLFFSLLRFVQRWGEKSPLMDLSNFFLLHPISIQILLRKRAEKAHQPTTAHIQKNA